MYGKDQPIELNLLGSERSYSALEAVAMELEDSLYPLLREVGMQGLSQLRKITKGGWGVNAGKLIQDRATGRSLLLARRFANRVGDVWWLVWQ